MAHWLESFWGPWDPTGTPPDLSPEEFDVHFLSELMTAILDQAVGNVEGLSMIRGLTSWQGVRVSPTSGVDGEHSIPRANQNGKLENGWLNTGSGGGLDADTLDGINSTAFALLAGANVWSGTNVPNANGTLDLGASGTAWLKVFAQIIDSGGLVDLILRRNGADRLLLGSVSAIFSVDFLGIGGTAATHAALKRVAGPELEARKGDDSGYANLRAGVLRSGDGAAGAKSIELINSAGRLILQATPTVDRTVTIQDATHTIAGINIANAWSNTQDFGSATLQHKRGVEAELPTLASGELYVATDTSRIFMGV